MRFYFLSSKQIFDSGYEPNTYSLEIRGSDITLFRETEDEGEEPIDHFSFPDSFLNSPIKISIHVNKSSRQFITSINGIQRKKVKDEYNIFAGQGSIIAFVNRGKSLLKVSDIIASKCEIKNKKSNQNKKKLNNNTDIIYLNNNDQITGYLQQVKSENIILKTDFAEMKIPLKRISHIKQRTDSINIAKRRKNDIQVHLSDMNGHITLNLQSISDTLIKGNSDNFGNIKLKLPFFSSIKFNIYNNKTNNNILQDRSNGYTDESFLDIENAFIEIDNGREDIDEN